MARRCSRPRRPRCSSCAWATRSATRSWTPSSTWMRWRPGARGPPARPRATAAAVAARRLPPTPGTTAGRPRLDPSPGPRRSPAARAAPRRAVMVRGRRCGGAGAARAGRLAGGDARRARRGERRECWGAQVMAGSVPEATLGRAGSRRRRCARCWRPWASATRPRSRRSTAATCCSCRRTRPTSRASWASPRCRWGPRHRARGRAGPCRGWGAAPSPTKS